MIKFTKIADKKDLRKFEKDNQLNGYTYFNDGKWESDKIQFPCALCDVKTSVSGYDGHLGFRGKYTYLTHNVYTKEYYIKKLKKETEDVHKQIAGAGE